LLAVFCNCGGKSVTEMALISLITLLCIV